MGSIRCRPTVTLYMYIVDSISLFVNCDVDKDHTNFCIDIPYSSNILISHCIWNTVFSCKLDIENFAEFHTHGLNQNWKSVEIWSTSTVIKVMNLKSIYNFLYYRHTVRKKLSYSETNLYRCLVDIWFVFFLRKLSHCYREGIFGLETLQRVH